MLRSLVDWLLVLSALNIGFGAHSDDDALPTLHHPSVAECLADEARGAIDSEEVSFIQRKAQVRESNKVNGDSKFEVDGKAANRRPPSMAQQALFEKLNARFAELEAAKKQKGEAEARWRAAEARLKAEEEAHREAAELLALKAEEDPRGKAEAEAFRKAAEAKAEEDARMKAVEDDRRKATEEAEEHAQMKAVEDARRKATEEALLKAQQEVRRKAVEEARLKAEEETLRKAQEEEQSVKKYELKSNASTNLQKNPQANEDKESAMEGRLTRMEKQMAAFEAMEERQIAELEAKLQDEGPDAPAASTQRDHLHSATSARSAAHSLARSRHGKINKARLHDADDRLEHDNALAHDAEVEGHYVLHRRMMVFLGVVFVVTLGGMAMCAYLDPSDDDKEDDTFSPRDEVDHNANEPLPEDTLGFMICVYVRDTEAIAEGTSKIGMRLTRILSAFGVLALNQFLQVYLTVCICLYVVPQYVVTIREAYEEFEKTMYENHTTSVTGEIRGMNQTFYRPRRFWDLDSEVREQVCQSPFSELWFFIPLLFIWTLRCGREIKNACILAMLLCAKMPTVPSLKDQLTDRKEADNVTIKVITGLTLVTKRMIFCVMLLPRIMVSAYLCWLGSRWLAAAPDLGELVLNTVALEIMVELKDLLYATLISPRNKRDLHRTEMKAATKVEKASIWLFTSSLFWALGALGWVWFYLYYFQMVILDFRWDLHSECASWLLTRFPRNIV